VAHADFVHLHVHTAYSLSEGAIRVGELAALCRRHRMPAVAITDTNNLFGGMDFSLAVAAVGVQPIIGCQLGIAGDEASPVGRSRPQARADSIVLLVQNAAGYANLLRLLAAAHLDGGAAGAPQVPLAAVETHGQGLILLTGGPAGPVDRLLADGQPAAARAVLERLARAFPDRLYVELMRHGVADEAAIEARLLDLADRLSLPAVATNDVYFAAPDMFEAHDVLICIAEGALQTDPQRRRLTPEHWFKSAEEMARLFADVPEACANTVAIARRCAFMIEPRKPLLPSFPEGKGRSEPEILKEQAEAGLARRLERCARLAALSAGEREEASAAYRRRLAYELDVICAMGFAGYFLIVAEFIGWARDHGIPVGPGRGSGAGSVVAWALTITDLDPIRFGLLFERFLNPERVSMPDFDIDFCQDRRDEVIHHVQERYGGDRVAQIITFGKLQARAVLRDVGRVLGMPYGQVDKICKLVPYNPANPVTLAQAIEAEPQLKSLIDNDETVGRLVDLARRLEGLYRHASTHAAGVVIGDRPLVEQIPLYRDPRSDLPVTGFNMKWIEQAGLVKFDFLGLKTLTVLAEAEQLIRAGGGDIDLTALPLDDARTFALLGEGETVGVFQLESAGMRDALRKLKPDCFEDIIAVVALYRPGPMENIASYIRRKHGLEPVDSLHPSLEPILRETYGIIIYQEQVMQIAQELSGFSLGSADLLRRAMGKKNKEEMEKQRRAFIDGAVAGDVPPARASSIFDLVNKFAGYGFNKSHAAAYALIAYQTAYLKANFAVEYFAASMALERDHPEKLGVFRQELERAGIPLLPPDINASEASFTVERSPGGLGAIRYGLAAVKNVGLAAMQAVVDERRANGPFTSIADLARRVDPRLLNKRQLENLALAGAFDRLDGNRRRVYEGAEAILRCAAAAAADRGSGQMGLFGGTGAGAIVPSLPETADWPPMERLKHEFEAIGFYLSAHPLQAYDKALRRLRVVGSADLLHGGRDGIVTLAGTVTARRERTSGRGTRYAFVEASDTSGTFEVTVFSEVLSAARDLLEVGTALLFRVTAQVDGEGVRLTAQSVESLDRAAAKAPVTLAVSIDSAEPLPELEAALAGQRFGAGRVTLVSWIDGGREVEVLLPGHYAIDPAFIARLTALRGVSGVAER
jgi:DNA polymerase-3 subunit alpha